MVPASGIAIQPLAAGSSVLGVVEQAGSEFVQNFVAALPTLIAGALFLALATVAVKGIVRALRFALKRALPEESKVYRTFIAHAVELLLWFAVLLSLLSVLGLGKIAAALGTASGFVAAGISYALSEMVEDIVAGVYLLDDPDFVTGARIRANGITGEVVTIQLRKTRIETDDGLVVVNNSPIERKWTRLDVSDSEESSKKQS